MHHLTFITGAADVPAVSQDRQLHVGPFLHSRLAGPVLWASATEGIEQPVASLDVETGEWALIANHWPMLAEQDGWRFTEIVVHDGRFDEDGPIHVDLEIDEQIINPYQDPDSA